MGDLSDALEILSPPEGINYNMLTAVEKVNNDISKHFFTDRDKNVLCQFEDAAMPANTLCKFLQSKNPGTWSYITFHLQLTPHNILSPTISIYPETSHSNHVKNLYKRGEKKVLVKKS